MRTFIGPSRHARSVRESRFVRALWRLCLICVAQLGLRLDRARPAWITALVLAVGLGLAVAEAHSRTLTLAYFAATWLFYYGGNTLILGMRLNETAIRRLGPDAAFRRYETLVGTMFASQGLGVGAMCALDSGAWRLPIAPEIAMPVGLLLFIVGFGTKIWAIHLVGLDTYYFKDLFLGQTQGPFVSRGPYRFLANPMYGVGQIHGYGFALASGSLTGLAAAAICQLSIYGFYFAVERPFIARVYLSSAR